jgi:hypothetical protein
MQKEKTETPAKHRPRVDKKSSLIESVIIITNPHPSSILTDPYVQPVLDGIGRRQTGVDGPHIRLSRRH